MLYSVRIPTKMTMLAVLPLAKRKKCCKFVIWSICCRHKVVWDFYYLKKAPTTHIIINLKIRNYSNCWCGFSVFSLNKFIHSERCDAVQSILHSTSNGMYIIQTLIWFSMDIVTFWRSESVGLGELFIRRFLFKYFIFGLKISNFWKRNEMMKFTTDKSQDVNEGTDTGLASYFSLWINKYKKKI